MKSQASLNLKRLCMGRQAKLSSCDVGAMSGALEGNVDRVRRMGVSREDILGGTKDGWFTLR